MVEIHSNMETAKQQANPQAARDAEVKGVLGRIKHKFIIMSGKGGVGKSLVAAAIAARQARLGRKVQLVEFGRRSFYQGFLQIPPGSDRSPVLPGVHVARWEGRQCLREYVGHLFRLGPAADLFLNNAVVSALVGVAPGLNELALTGKLTSGHRLAWARHDFDDIVVTGWGQGKVSAKHATYKTVATINSLARAAVWAEPACRSVLCMGTQQSVALSVNDKGKVLLPKGQKIDGATLDEIRPRYWHEVQVVEGKGKVEEVAQRMKELGADIVVHSITKFISGMSDVIAGAVCGTKEFIESLMDLHVGPMMLLGPTMDPKIASKLSLRIPHLPIRMVAHGERALALAERLQDAGVTVGYPGLADHPDRALFDELRCPDYGYGGVLTIDMGEEAKANELMSLLQNKYRFGFIAVSLGYFDTLMSCSASTTSTFFHLVPPIACTRATMPCSPTPWGAQISTSSTCMLRRRTPRGKTGMRPPRPKR